MDDSWKRKPDLRTPGGRVIPHMKFVPASFIGRTTIAFGPSRTGKSVILKNIMCLLKGDVQQVIIVAPQEPSNHTYRGIVEPQFIHTTMRLASEYRAEQAAKAAGRRPPRYNPKQSHLDFLEELWKRQDAITQTYNRTNELRLLTELFDSLPAHNRAPVRLVLQRLSQVHARALAEIRRHEAEHKLTHGTAERMRLTADEKFKEACARVFKGAIMQCRDALWRSLPEPPRGDAHRFLLQNIGISPAMLLVLDDCVEIVKKLGNSELWCKYFYQARHVSITLLGGLQDDTDLAKSLRKNVFNSFFTTQTIAIAYFSRAGNGFTRSEREEIERDICPTVYDSQHPYRKLVYIRDDPDQYNFYYLDIPEAAPFRFGSDATNQLARAVSNNGADAGDNPYYARFQPAADARYEK